jgi:uncharacterized membrane protein (UPF0127 family)
VFAARLDRLPRCDVLEHRVPVAIDRRSRLLGLALLDRSRAGAGLLIPRCASVHSFGMRFALDVFFLGAEGACLRIERGVPPGRILACRGAAAVLEIPSQGESLGPQGLRGQCFHTDMRSPPSSSARTMR